MRSGPQKITLLILLLIVFACASCIFAFAPSQYPRSRPAPECISPMFTRVPKPHSVTLVITQCRLSSDPYEQVRDWYHTQPVGLMSRLPGFPSWNIGPLGFSIYTTLDLPPLSSLEGSNPSGHDKIAVITQTSYTLSW
jgi:hypothetical protein